VVGVVFKGKGVVGRFSQGRQGGEGKEWRGVAWGIEGKVIPGAFRRRKLPIYSISLWKRLIFNRYNSWGVISRR
jgi:hypothetical protein